MTDFTTYTQLKRIVSYTLDELDKSIADFDKCWVLSFRGLVDLNFSIAGETLTIRIPLSPNQTAPLPPNCLMWTKIGIVDSGGKINTLKVNNALTTFRDNNPQRLEDLTPNINDNMGSQALVPYYSNFYYGGGCFQLFGVGNGVITYGDCKVDEKNRVIIFPPDFQYDSVLVEFVDCPEKNDDYQVPTCLQEAIIAFIKWKLKLGSRDEYYAAAINGRRSLPKKRVDLQTINQVIRESDGMKLRS